MERRLHVLLRAWCLAACATLAGCSDQAPIYPCDPCFTSAVAHVYVRDSTGLPVARVPVDVRAYFVQCGTGLLGFEGLAVTDSLGHRRLLLSSLDSPHVAHCVRVRINPASNPGFPVDSQDFADSIAFRVEDSSPRDSIRLDVVVPRR